MGELLGRYYAGDDVTDVGVPRGVRVGDVTGGVLVFQAIGLFAAFSFFVILRGFGPGLAS